VNFYKIAERRGIMNILLINPHIFWVSEGNTLKLRSRMFYDNLSIRYIASALENAGHKVDIIDAHFEEISLEEINKIIKSRNKYDIYGISCTQRILDNALFVANYIKHIYKDAIIVVGGYAATLMGPMLLEKATPFDIAMIGEGENSFIELVKYAENRDEWNKIPNIFYRDGENIIRTKAGKMNCNLDDLAWPKRAEKYPAGKANILASRGCYGQCAYCSITEFHRVSMENAFRIRSAIDVVDEMEYLYKEKNVYYFDFVDDSFATIFRENKEWVDIFVAELEKRNLHLTWGIQSRAIDVDYEIFKKLHKVGLRAVSIGIENNVERIIKFFRTGTNYEIHKKSIEILKKLNINYFIEMIILEPLTTLEEVKQNIEFLKDIDYCGAAIQTPITFSPKLELYIGTPIVKMYEGKVNLRYTKHAVEYDFVNKEVALLRKALLYWQSKTGDIAAFHMTYQFYVANKQKKIGLALQTIKLSKRYLQFDLNVYESLVDYLGNHGNCSMEDIKIFLHTYEEQVEEFRQTLQTIYSELN